VIGIRAVCTRRNEIRSLSWKRCAGNKRPNDHMAGMVWDYPFLEV
jgi:hypothetical protein